MQSVRLTSLLVGKMCQTAILVALAFCSLSLYATDNRSDSVEVKFRQGKSELDIAFKNNGQHLDSIISNLDKESVKGNVTGVKVIGGASPEGSVEINKTLSRRRADKIFNYIDERVALPDSLTKFRYLGRDWAGLRALVEDDQKVPFRAQVLDLLDEILSDSAAVAQQRVDYLRRLKQIGNGDAYRYMYWNLFPALRKSVLVVEYDVPQAVSEPAVQEPTVVADTVVTEVVTQQISELPPVVEQAEKKPFYMDVRTNMLFDALAVPNLGVEFYLGKNWTIGANGMYAWWSSHKRNRYWRIYGGEVNVRKWFGKAAAKKPLTGHHLGAHAGLFTFDFEFGGVGIMGGKPHGTLRDRCMAYAGVEYGYSLPVARRLNIDFTIGVGYIGGKYIKYEPDFDSYNWISKHNLNYVGVTKAEISLVWLIGRGNKNKRGGDR